MQWSRKRDCAVKHYTLYVCYGWRFNHSTLRWEQLCAHKGNSPTLPRSYTLVVRSRCLTNSQKVNEREAVSLSMTSKSTESPHRNNQHKQLMYLSRAKDTQLCSVCLTAKQLNTNKSHRIRIV